MNSSTQEKTTTENQNQRLIFQSIDEFTLAECYSVLGETDYEYIETNSHLEQLAMYREALLSKIKELRYGNN